MSQAGFCRELTKMVAAEGRKVNASSLANFMGQKGPSGGSGSIVFYAAYVYFEKMRLRDGKPKSQMRQEMESVWDKHGMDLPEEGRGGQEATFVLETSVPTRTSTARSISLVAETRWPCVDLFCLYNMRSDMYDRTDFSVLDLSACVVSSFVYFAQLRPSSVASTPSMPILSLPLTPIMVPNL